MSIVLESASVKKLSLRADFKLSKPSLTPPPSPSPLGITKTLILIGTQKHCLSGGEWGNFVSFRPYKSFGLSVTSDHCSAFLVLVIIAVLSPTVTEMEANPGANEGWLLFPEGNLNNRWVWGFWPLLHIKENI